MGLFKKQDKDIPPELKAVRTADAIVDFSLIAFFLLLLIFTLYATWDNQTVETSASPEQWEKYKPTDRGYASFEELQRINPDAVAWLELYGTNIDYPVMYSAKSNKYLTMDPLGNYSLTGSLFIDSDSASDFSDLQTFIYGHHMDKSLMFGSLDEFAKEQYFMEHQYGKLTYGGEEHGLEIWMLFRADAYDTKVYQTGIRTFEEEEKYLLLIQSKQERIRSSCEVTPDDHIVLMSTCAGETTNGRTILVAKILDWVPDDPFAKTNAGSSTDGLPTWLGIPIYAWILLGIAVMGGALLFVWGRRDKEEDEEDEEQEGKEGSETDGTPGDDDDADSDT